MATSKPETTEKRHRKKKLISDVRQQLEFYFSSANLQKDLFMQELLAESPYIQIEIFSKFNRMKTLSTEPKIIEKAIETSQLLELSDDKLGVKRKVPTQKKENEMDCTIYIEGVPPTADHGWIRKMFSRYGHTDYISLPKFKETGQCKGFAFVEYQTESQALSAIADFKGSTADPAEPDELLSIKTYNKSGCETADLVANKRAHSDESVSGGTLPSSKKAKPDEELSVHVPKKKKKNRKRNPVTDKEPVASKDDLCLKVMPKRQWKTLRNDYLDTMKRNKRLVYEYVNSYYGDSSFSGAAQPNKPSFTAEDAAKMPVFVPDAVVKIDVDEMPLDKKIFKKTVTEEHVGVAYIEINELLQNVHIRFQTSEHASTFMQSGQFESKLLLNGDQESIYWENLYSQWIRSNAKKNRKLNKNSTTPLIGPQLPESAQ